MPSLCLPYAQAQAAELAQLDSSGAEKRANALEKLKASSYKASVTVAREVAIILLTWLIVLVFGLNMLVIVVTMLVIGLTVMLVDAAIYVPVRVGAA